VCSRSAQPGLRVGETHNPRSIIAIAELAPIHQSRHHRNVGSDAGPFLQLLVR
jgi:hypothetical protein